MPRNNRKSENTEGRTSIDVNAAPRVIVALDYFAQGMTYEQIAARAGYASRSGAFTAIQRELQRHINKNIEKAQELQGYQLDRALQVVMERIIKNDKDSLWAVDRLVPLLKRKAELFGLDAKDTGLPPGVTLVREIGTSLEQL